MRPLNAAGYRSRVGERQAFDKLSAAVLALNRHLSVQEVLQTIVTAARDLLDCEYSALGVPDEQMGFKEFVVDGITDEQWAAIGPLPRQHGLLGAILREGKPQRIADVRSDPRFGWWPAAHPVMEDMIGMPVTNGDEVLGAIYLANRRHGRFTGRDEELLAVLAAHAAIALTNARLYERSRELTLLEERHRVARELHDAVAQKLFSLRLTAEAAATLLPKDPGRAQASLDEVRELAAQATEELGQVIAELRPRELTDAGLVETLRRRVALLNRVHDAELSFHSTVQSRLSIGAEEVVLRVVEEALHNALRHSGASHIAVTLKPARWAGMTVTIADDGTGFDPGPARGLGLVSMKERARRINGHLTVNSRPGKGTTLSLGVPGGA
jgi:signal transduction histidine kinase